MVKKTDLEKSAQFNDGTDQSRVDTKSASLSEQFARYDTSPITYDTASTISPGNDPEMVYKAARINSKEAVGIFSWWILSIITSAMVLFGGNGKISAIAGLLFIPIVLTLIYHCRVLAARKWNSPNLGFLGILPIIGVIILVALPGKAWRKKQSDYQERRRKQLSSWSRKRVKSFW